MDPESKKLLQDTYVLTQDNNRMLRSITRSMHFSRIINIIYWVIIIGSGIGAFYFVQPYIDQITKTYGGISNALRGVR